MSVKLYDVEKFVNVNQALESIPKKENESDYVFRSTTDSARWGGDTR